MVVVSAAVEGLVDEAVIKSLIAEAGAVGGQVMASEESRFCARVLAATTTPRNFGHG